MMAIDLSQNILFEDDNLIVLNKPPKISVTPGPGNPLENTVAGWLLNYVGDSLYQVGLEDRWGVVHRLDKDTSGVMLFAINSEMYDHLVNQFQERRVKKVYTALVWGDVHKTLEGKGYSGTKTFTIDAPIGRHPSGFSKFIVSEEGKSAKTAFEVVDTFNVEDREGDLPLTLVEARPETGRTHQIRVHIKAFGHVIVGDKTYQTRTQHAISQRIVERQFLHASKIEFVDMEGSVRVCTASLAVDLSESLKKLV